MCDDDFDYDDVEMIEFEEFVDQINRTMVKVISSEGPFQGVTVFSPWARYRICGDSYDYGWKNVISGMHNYELLNEINELFSSVGWKVNWEIEQYCIDNDEEYPVYELRYRFLFTVNHKFIKINHDFDELAISSNIFFIRSKKAISTIKKYNSQKDIILDSKENLSHCHLRRYYHE
jgi:hypothetical protein